MKFLILFLITTTLLLSNDEISLENDFLQSLNEVSEIATKTKLNIDDVPSFVTVLHNKKLQKLGVTNVFEALGLVPGVSLQREASGVPIVVFRGVSQKSEVKLMVDGVSINNNYRGSIYPYLHFPIELVERIEVIRGAGSVLYGSGAISGVVNIITKSASGSDTNSIFLSGGTEDSYQTGAYVTSNLGDLNFAVDAYYKNRNKEIQNTDRHLTDYSFGISLQKDKFGLLARTKKSEQGNAYGLLGVQDTNQDKYDNINETSFIQLSYKDTLSKNNKLEVTTGYSEYSQNIEASYPSSAVDSIKTNYKENTYHVEANLISSSFTNHEILLGMRYESSKTKKSDWNIDGIPTTPISKPGLKRDTTSLYLADNFSLNSVIDILAGVRYDNYSDYGDSFSPNLGIVYRLNKKIKLKAQYSHAFRAPSWIELTSNPSLNAETSHSFEAGIIYKANNENTLKMNIYSFDIDNMITKPARTYVQNTHNKFNGVELEYIYIPNDNIEINVLASYINARDEDGEALANVANTLASSSLIYTTDSGINFGSYLKYVSSSPRTQTDAREDMSSSIIFDETISYSFKNFTTSLIIKDLFNQGTYYALPQSRNIDFYSGGRSFIVRASLEF